MLESFIEENLDLLREEPRLVQWLLDEIDDPNIVNSNPSPGYQIYHFSHFCCKIVRLLQKTEDKRKEVHLNFRF